ncbi:MAG TPA: M4 family metallopeptidase [Thermoanaerobaculia bacterium]|nr:M4 family metallopeptidase [Thermoanaerobaculia bacterium]
MFRRIPPSPSPGIAASIALFALAFPFGGRTASAADSVPQVRALRLEGSQAESIAAEPGGPEGIAGRVAAALAAAKNPEQPVPHPLSATAQASPLAARLGKDVTLVRRPGVGTPMQIRGDRLQERVEVVQSADASDSATATAKAFLRSNREVLGLADPDAELQAIKVVEDELGMRHIRFEQRFRGLAVWPGALIVHLDARGDVSLMDGAYVFTPHLPTLEPVLDSLAATQKARLAIGATPAALTTRSELVVYAPGTRAPRLAWKIDLSGRPSETVSVFIDALNGVRLADVPRVMSENVVGSGIDLFGASVTLNVWNVSGTFRLIDTSKPMFDPTSQVLDQTKTRGAIYIQDATNQPPSNDPDVSLSHPAIVTSTSSISWAPRDAVSAASNFGKVFDYYKERHTRNSIDGQGGNILAVVRVGAGWHNAFWTDDIGGMFFGDADRYAGSVDVVGHEMTHGVTSKTAGLVYQDQSGALNEALSDIFGEMVENYATGSNDWIVGSRMANPIRNMANPAQFGDPAKMSQYVQTTTDHGGVHTNSGIINQAYYLLAQGMPGAIGLRDSERIFYRALTVHLTKNAQFLDARLAAIQSADEIFGVSSNQSQKTAKAFDTVEVLASTPAPPPPNVPPVSGTDSAIVVYRDGTLLLGRREAALGDPSQGSRLTTTPVANERPSVSGDGSIVFFVSAANDGCFVPTNGSQAPSCLGLPGQIASVAMSRDQSSFAFVFLNGGQRDNRIGVVDLQRNTTTVYRLVSPATDGGTTGTVLFADTLDFTANSRFLLYDNFNVLTQADGSRIGVWSISGIDRSGGIGFSLIPPVRGFDIANPSVARTSDDYFTFEAVDETSGKSDIYAARASTGDVNQVVTGVGSGFTSPVYSGNDRAIVYSYPDSTAATGRSLASIPIAADRLTAAGQPTPYLFDGQYGVVYRRGTYTTPTGNCTASPGTLCLSNGRFQVSATFTTTAGQQGSGAAVRLTSDTGYFTFFDPANVEVVVKVLNGCGLNQRLWVFAGGLTNVATVITVTDTATGVTRTYANPQNTPFQPIQDTSAFTTCFTGSIAAQSAAAQGPPEDAEHAAERAREEIRAALVAPREYVFTAEAPSDHPAPLPPAAGASMARQPEDAAPDAVTACTADAQSLCLNNGRFRVQTTFRTAQGQTGNGNAVRLTADTGYFWFFDANNVEIIVKALNGCGFNSRFWTFAGGLTNVQVTMTVTDTQTGAVKTYTNPLNQAFQPLQDTAAFVCP